MHLFILLYLCPLLFPFPLPTGFRPPARSAPTEKDIKEQRKRIISHQSGSPSQFLKIKTGQAHHITLLIFDTYLSSSTLAPSLPPLPFLSLMFRLNPNEHGPNKCLIELQGREIMRTATFRYLSVPLFKRAPGKRGRGKGGGNGKIDWMLYVFIRSFVHFFIRLSIHSRRVELASWRKVRSVEGRRKGERGNEGQGI